MDKLSKSSPATLLEHERDCHTGKTQQESNVLWCSSGHSRTGKDSTRQATCSLDRTAHEASWALALDGFIKSGLLIQQLAISQTGTIGNVRHEGNVGGQDLTDACSAKRGCIEVGGVGKEDDVVVVECGHVGGDG